MTTKRNITIAILLGIALCIATPTLANLKAKPDGGLPVVLSMSPSSVQRGNEVLITVYFDGPAPDYGTMSISKNANDWSSIPNSVNFQPDVSSVQFYGTVSASTQASSTVVTATANGQSVNGTLTITQ